MKNKILKYTVLILITTIFIATASHASPTIIPKETTSKAFDTNSLLTLIAVVLLIPIYLLGKTLLFSAKLFAKKEKEHRNSTTKILLIIVGLCITHQNFAQEVAATTSSSESLLTLKNLLVGVILLEAFVIVFLGTYILSFLKGNQIINSTEEAKKPSFNIQHTISKWWKKSNNFIPIEEEANIDSGHSYDGIRELDNNIPVWFSAAFVICILIAASYLWRYHVSESAPLQIAEYQNEMAQAAKEKEEYLQNAANNVDENSVVLLDAAGIEAGKTLFVANCVTCHGANAASVPGGVGPNLTDTYWLHGGSLKDIFKTIKYGWPDKGMRSWQDQLSPTQISQLASFVKSVSNANLKGKEPQGDVFKEEAASNADTTASKK
jgi:cytochrome c oxidase cbb3-type subunit III